MSLLLLPQVHSLLRKRARTSFEILVRLEVIALELGGLEGAEVIVVEQMHHLEQPALTISTRSFSFARAQTTLMPMVMKGAEMTWTELKSLCHPWRPLSCLFAHLCESLSGPSS